jgi:hypothetical protein
MTDKTKPRTSVAQDVAALRAVVDGQHATPETPAEVLADIRRRIESIRSTTSLGYQTGPYAYAGEDMGQYLRDATDDCRDILQILGTLERALAAGKVAQSVGYVNADGTVTWYTEKFCTVSLKPKAGTEIYTAPPADPAIITPAMIPAFRTSLAYDVGFKDGQKQGCGRCNDMTKPCDISGGNCAAYSADPDKASEPESWEVISMRHLADGLRARGDDLSTDAASWLEKFSKGGIAKASGSAPDVETVARKLFGSEQRSRSGEWAWDECSSIEREGWTEIAQAAIEILQPSTPPASAPEVTQEMEDRAVNWLMLNWVPALTRHSEDGLRGMVIGILTAALQPEAVKAGGARAINREVAG